MRLKSLEIKGFKSFANETVINFNEDVIGIVGPNGSGKSNIVDAIRWVLGEQKTKELRLDKMGSVIFNGTKKKKAGGLAQVSLSFENTKNLLPTEYHTVKITRILYRSGESEYQLNGVRCRLKDITSLFLDTGVGSNSYAIIALGMVDDLIADKDGSRRKMFEQAAGISKYKTRKKQTLNKLKNTEGDLDRIEDLLFEIEGNLKLLEKQAKRAKRYYELKEKYKELSLELAVLKVATYKGRHESVTEKLTTGEDDARQIEIDIRKIEADLEGDKKANVDKEKLLSERQKDLNILVDELRALEGNKKMLAQKQSFIEQNQIKLSSQINLAKSKEEQLAEEIDDYRSRLNDDKRVEAELEEKLEAVENKLNEIRANHGSLKSELDEYIQTQQRLEREVFEKEKNKAINTNQIENLGLEITRNTEGIAEKEVEVKHLDVQLAALKNEEKAKADQLDLIVKQETQRQEDVLKAEQELEDLNKKLVDVNRRLDSKRNEYKLTKSLVENLEGFPESIKFLSSNKNWSKQAPLLSDLLYCKEEYRVAIENYLEPYLNYYVVKTTADAFQAIQLLSKSQKGKANFFVLEAFKNYTPKMVMFSETQPAIDLIQTDSEYRGLIGYLLENVMLTDKEDLKSPEGNEDIVLLSRSGSFIQRRYSVSGGSVGLFEGKKIGRKKNLEVLEVAIKQLEKEETKLSSKYYTLKSHLEQLKAAIKNHEIQLAREALSQLAQQKVSVMTRLENFENMLRDFDQNRTQSELRIKGLEIQNEAIEKKLKESKAALEKAKVEISDTDGSYREVAEALSVASNNFNEKNIEFIRQQNLVSTIQRELSFRENQLLEIKSNLEKNQLTIQNGESELTQIQEELKELEITLLSSYELKTQKEASLSSAEQIYFQARGGIDENENKLRILNRKRQQTQMELQSLKDSFNELKLEMSSISERLKIEFNISIEEVMKRAPNEKLNVEELQPKVDRLKQRLDNYGEINPMAVEAYDEMKIRYDTIREQRKDILEAKASLLETIKEIEETATEQFLEAFAKVREYFIDVFRSLFTEDDNCDLILAEPDNPLDSAINIIAKPKGKRPQSINQLSGGEKTLTATALLFALYLLKPAPFCIFDEVDAPLDDANIEKFNKIIKKFSKDSQFIIVTHNKLTMAAVDIIYGVYMQEQGVSGLSPVDFRELDDRAVVGNFETVAS